MINSWLAGFVGETAAPIIGFILLFAFVLLAVVVLFAIIRRLGGGTFVAGGRNRAPRLSVMDAAAVDNRRRLVLVRRDDVEHLILIGGPTDVVVEQNIRLLHRQPPRAAAPKAAHDEPGRVPAAPVPVKSRQPSGPQPADISMRAGEPDEDRAPREPERHAEPEQAAFSEPVRERSPEPPRVQQPQAPTEAQRPEQPRRESASGFRPMTTAVSAALAAEAASALARPVEPASRPSPPTRSETPDVAPKAPAVVAPVGAPVQAAAEQQAAVGPAEAPAPQDEPPEAASAEPAMPPREVPAPPAEAAPPEAPVVASAGDAATQEVPNWVEIPDEAMPEEAMPEEAMLEEDEAEIGPVVPDDRIGPAAESAMPAAPARERPAEPVRTAAAPAAERREPTVDVPAGESAVPFDEEFESEFSDMFTEDAEPGAAGEGEMPAERPIRPADETGDERKAEAATIEDEMERLLGELSKGERR